MKNLSVELGHCRNPDIGGGYWQEPVDPAKKRRVAVADLAEAVRVCEAFISRNGLGGGNWNAGRVFQDGKQVAKVSYNGRLWGMDGKEIPQAGVKTAAQHRAEGWKDYLPEPAIKAWVIFRQDKPVSIFLEEPSKPFVEGVKTSGGTFKSFTLTPCA